MRHVSVAEAKAKLSEILDGVIAGDEVMITRRGKDVARLSLPQATAPRAKLDIEALKALHAATKPYPGNSVVDMRNDERY
jgi:antitoxin (DNA-binding transcriptional repressor) of toxin-antitoxin stability system